MEPAYQLAYRIVHLPNRVTVVGCTGLHIVDNHSQTARPGNAMWKFTSPKDGPKLSFTMRGASTSQTLKKLAEKIEESGYKLPSAFGAIADTNLTNLAVKTRVIQVRVNTEGKDTQRFSFQYDRSSFTSYDDAMHNALELRDLLRTLRTEAAELRMEGKQARELMKALQVPR